MWDPIQGNFIVRATRGHETTNHTILKKIFKLPSLADFSWSFYMSTTSVNSEQKRMSIVSTLLPIPVEVVRRWTKSPKWGRSFDHCVHSPLPASSLYHRTRAYTWNTQRRASPGDIPRQPIPANSSDPPFHSQENNGVPKWGKFRTMDLGTDGRLSLFPFKTKEQRYLKKTHSSTHKGQFPPGLPPSSPSLGSHSVSLLRSLCLPPGKGQDTEHERKSFQRCCI